MPLPISAESTSPGARPDRIEQISLSDLWSTLWQARKTLLNVTVAITLISAATAFLLPHWYIAEAVILTPQQPQSSLSTLAQLTGLGSGGGIAGLSLLTGFGLRNPADLYVGILQSRTIADRIINRFHLKEVYGDEDFHSARKHLARHTTIRSGRDTLIRIRVEDRQPRRAAQLANAYVEELSNQNSSVALGEASQRRLFFEQQLAKEKDALSAAEIALRDTQQVTGLVVPTGQAEAIIRSVSQLHAEILMRQAQVAGMRSFVADDNPRLQVVRRELSELQGELSRLERGTHIAGTPEVPTSQLPQAGLAYIRKYRDVKYHETLYEVLAKQYEAARLDEAKSAPLVQVVDTAVVPERKSWPPRVLIILITTVLSGSLAALCIVMMRLRGGRLTVSNP